jgi:hypothetical protein
MDRTCMFMDQQNQYLENGYTTECNLQIQCNTHKILMTFFTVIQKPIITFMWKHKRLWIAKAILSKIAILEVTQYVISNNAQELY